MNTSTNTTPENKTPAERDGETLSASYDLLYKVLMGVSGGALAFLATTYLLRRFAPGALSDACDAAADALDAILGKPGAPTIPTADKERQDEPSASTRPRCRHFVGPDEFPDSRNLGMGWRARVGLFDVCELWNENTPASMQRVPFEIMRRALASFAVPEVKGN